MKLTPIKKAVTGWALLGLTMITALPQAQAANPAGLGRTQQAGPFEVTLIANPTTDAL